jgi:type I restriction enzyme R subunit
MRDALPQASFARTRTRAAGTRSVFSDYISIYDIARAVEDGATVPIYYEGRLAKLELSEAERPNCRPNVRRRAHGRGPRKHAIRAG